MIGGVGEERNVVGRQDGRFRVQCCFGIVIGHVDREGQTESETFARRRLLLWSCGCEAVGCIARIEGDCADGHINVERTILRGQFGPAAQQGPCVTKRHVDSHRSRDTRLASAGAGDCHRSAAMDGFCQRVPRTTGATAGGECYGLAL